MEIINKVLKILYNYLLDLIFPKKCMICKNIFDFGSDKRGICDQCIKIFEKPPKEGCVQCGKETKYQYCNVCSNLLKGKLYKDNKFYFKKNYSIFVYNEAAREPLLNLKYRKELELLEGFEKIIRLRLEEIDLPNIDIIIPVPMYHKKERKRGFNQAKLFSEIVSNIIKIEYNDKILIRNKNTTVQSNKNIKDRYENLENCFSVVNNDVIDNKTILLIDDIYTSGSTINTCAKELIQNGCKEVFSLTISIIENDEKN